MATKFTDQQIETIQSLYSTGMSVNKIAKEMGCAFDTVKKVISDFESRYHKKGLLCPDTTKLKFMVESNQFGLQDICDEFGVSRIVVPRWIEENNFKMVRKKPPTKLPQDVHDKLSDKKWINYNYTEHGTKKLGDILGIADGTVGRYLEAHGIDRDATFSCSSSRPEQELASILSEYLAIETNKRTILDNRFELDIWIPDKNIAIEFNGLYWHREEIKGKNYHYDKWKACQEKGIRLIQIWEDDWMYKKDIVLSSLFTKIGISNSPKVGARKCEIVSLDKDISLDFLDHTHIQGSVPGSIRLGLVYGEHLVACMVLKKFITHYELVRYSTSINVMGGFTKLLTYFERTFNPTKLVTFADLCISDGSLYEKTGFRFEQLIRPDYKYYVGNRRVHKFNYRKSRFRSDDSLKFDYSMTERELAKLNGLHRVYEAGKIRYVKIYTDDI